MMECPSHTDHRRYNCKTFGQNFRRADRSFYSKQTVTCQANKTWSLSTLPWPCKCEYTTQGVMQ